MCEFTEVEIEAAARRVLALRTVADLDARIAETAQLRPRTVRPMPAYRRHLVDRHLADRAQRMARIRAQHETETRP